MNTTQQPGDKRKIRTGWRGKRENSRETQRIKPRGFFLKSYYSSSEVTDTGLLMETEKQKILKKKGG